MTDFFRFPHTPHLAWLGSGMPRDDKLLSSEEANELLSGTVVIEEKLDGANLGISVGADGKLRAQNRGQYLTLPYSGQFSRLNAWLNQHQSGLVSELGSTLILFGEWCAARHSLDYAQLPDWFLVFDVYDLKHKHFWSSSCRNKLAQSLGLSTVPQLFSGRASQADIKHLLKTNHSRFRDGPPEGLVIRKESADYCEARAKLVCAEFTQTMGEHWRDRAIEWNCIKHTGIEQ